MDDGQQSACDPADLSALFQSRLREMTAGDARGARVPEAMNGPIGTTVVDDGIDLEAVVDTGHRLLWETTCCPLSTEPGCA